MKPPRMRSAAPRGLSKRRVQHKNQETTGAAGAAGNGDGVNSLDLLRVTRMRALAFYGRRNVIAKIGLIYLMVLVGIVPVGGSLYYFAVVLHMIGPIILALAMLAYERILSLPWYIWVGLIAYFFMMDVSSKLTTLNQRLNQKVHQLTGSAASSSTESKLSTKG